MVQSLVPQVLPIHPSVGLARTWPFLDLHGLAEKLRFVGDL